MKREIVVTSDPALLLDAKPFDETMLKAEGVPTDRRPGRLSEESGATR